MLKYLNDLAKAEKPFFIIEGEESFLKDLWRKKLVAKYSIDFSTVVHLDGIKNSINEIASALSERSLFAETCAFLIDNVCSIADKDRKKFIKNLSACPSLVIGFTPNLYWLKKSSKPNRYSDTFIKQLASKGHLLDGNKKPEYVLLDWIKKRTRSTGLRPGQEELILEASGPDLQRIENNIEKVQILLKESPLSDDDIRVIVGSASYSTVHRTVDLFIYGRRKEFEKALDSVSKIQKASYFFKIFADTVYKIILAKHVKANGSDPSLYKRDFPTEKKFSVAWEAPLNLTILLKLYYNLGPFLAMPFTTWDDVYAYVRDQQLIIN